MTHSWEDWRAAAFLTDAAAREIKGRFGTPVHVYDLTTLAAGAEEALRMPAPFGLTVRFAMKACPHTAILRLFDRLGLHVDASSGYEVRRAQEAGVDLQRVQLTAQEMPEDLEALVKEGMLFNATSLHQLDTYGSLFPGGEASIRVNPGLGSGQNRRTNVGGPASSFGIWHEQLDEARRIAQRYGLRLTRLHSHIGSGADPDVWQRCAALTLGIARDLPEVHTVNLGGGFKVARAPGERDTDLQEVGTVVSEQLRQFQTQDDAGRCLHLEIEPGTLLTARAGAIVCTIIDVKETSDYRFIVVDSGMTDNLRPALYGAQHALRVVPQGLEGAPSGEGPRDVGEYLVAGHCCESGDLLTPAPGDPEGLAPRRLLQPRIGDLLLVGHTGAYSTSMAAANYNSFPQSAVLLRMPDGALHVIRRRQTWREMTAPEQTPDLEQALAQTLRPQRTRSE